MKRERILFVVLVLLVMGFLIFIPASAGLNPPSQGYYLFLGDIPSVSGGIDSTYSEAIQGVAHDDANWYFTQTTSLWRVPLGHDLRHVSSSEEELSVYKKPMSNYRQLADLKFDHFGDPECYLYEGEWYLVVPLDPDPGPYPAIAIFRSDLSLIGFHQLPGHVGSSWCAIDPKNGDLYSPSKSASGDSTVQRFLVNWPLIASGTVSLIQQGKPLQVTGLSGNNVSIDNWQGGVVIPPEGRLLYSTAGYWNDHENPEGILVIDLTTGRIVAQSTNGEMPFNFAFRPGNPDPAEEPEGLTFWDLDGRSPSETGGVTGQIHVCLLDNEWGLLQDEYYFKHYTNAITLDASYSGGGSNGRPESPYTALYDALAVTERISWDSARLRIRAGSYPEPGFGAITLSRPVQLFAEGGTARIRDRIVLDLGGAINVNRDGILRIL